MRAAAEAKSRTDLDASFWPPFLVTAVATVLFCWSAADVTKVTLDFPHQTPTPAITTTVGPPLTGHGHPAHPRTP